MQIGNEIHSETITQAEFDTHRNSVGPRIFKKIVLNPRSRYVKDAVIDICKCRPALKKKAAREMILACNIMHGHINATRDLQRRDWHGHSDAIEYPLARRLAAAKSAKLEFLKERYINDLRIKTSDEAIVEISDMPAFEHSTSSPDWSYYSKSCKWPKIHQLQTFRMTESFLREPQFFNFDNLSNIDCTLIETVDDIDVFSATWLVQNRGYAATEIQGFIAATKIIDTEYSYHSKKSAEHAVKQLKKKVEIEAKKSRNDDLYREFCKDLADVAIDPTALCVNVGLSDTQITRDDVVKHSGACSSGIDSYVAKHGVNELKQISARHLMQLYRKQHDHHIALTLFAMSTLR